jgi:DNA-directed RNA polymerase specialized sigma24 family protein
MLKDSDEELILLIQQDSEYFGEIIDRYEKKLSRYISRISNFSPDEKEDLLQDIFIVIYENIFDFEKGQKFSS